MYTISSTRGSSREISQVSRNQLGLLNLLIYQYTLIKQLRVIDMKQSVSYGTLHPPHPQLSNLYTIG